MRREVYLTRTRGRWVALVVTLILATALLGLAGVTLLDWRVAPGVVLSGAVLLMAIGAATGVRRLEREHALLSAAVDSVPAGIVIADRAGHIQTTNEQARRLFGLEHDEGAEPRVTAFLVAPSTSKADAATLEDFLSENSIRPTGYPYQLRLRSRTGEESDVDVALVSLEAGGDFHYVLVIQDVTERVEAERALRQAREELERRVSERTAALQEVNDRLHQEVQERKNTEAEREKLIRELRASLSRIKTLRGLVPICAHCKKIRDDQGYWNQIETYIAEHSDVEFSHGLCQDCARTLYPELYHDGT